jgi:hypothetical protein
MVSGLLSVCQWSTVNRRPLIEVTLKPYFLWEALKWMCHPHQLYPESQSAVDSGLLSVVC